MVFLNFTVSKSTGGIKAKSNWIKNMVGGTSGKLTDKGIKSFIASKVTGSKLADGRPLSGYKFINHHCLVTPLLKND